MKQPDVFISYASEDQNLVAIPLTQKLESFGIEVWLDLNEITLGNNFAEKIDNALIQCRYAVVILSPDWKP